MADIDDLVAKAVSKRILSEIDVDAIALRLAPQVAKIVEASLLKEIKGIYWGDLVNDIVYDNHKLFEGLVLKTLGIVKPPTTPKKSRR